MAGYSSRQSTYTTGDTIAASDTNDEFDALLTAFGTSGHTHDGTSGNGGNVTALRGHALTFGLGTAGTDVVVTFDGETNDGVLSWMEDEDYFKFADDLMVVDNETLIFGTDSNWTIKYDESGDDDLVFTGSDMSIESSTSAKPVLQLLNTNADANGATFKFNKNGASVADSDVIGNIDFVSEDDGSNVHTYGRIRGTVVDMTGGQEEGGIEFYVAEYDGTLTKGMDIVGLGSDGNITVDISTHDGAAGGLKLGGTLVTSTATELNLLDGLNCTTAELNLLDGSAKSTSSITIGDTDAIIVIDGSTTKQIPASDIKTYVGAPALTGSTNNTIVTVTGSNAVQGEATFTYDGSDLKILETTNDGNPSFTIGGADAESGKIQAVYDSGAQTLNYLEISTATADSNADAGLIRFDVDGTDIFDIDDGGITFANGSAWEIGVAATTSTTAGRALTIAAGSSATGSSNINGGDLTLSSGGGDGTGTSKIDFKTKKSGTDTPDSKMQLSGPGVLTLSAGGIVLPDAAGTVGTSTSTSAITIASNGNVTLSGDLTVSGDTTTVNTATLAVEDPLINLATGNNSSDSVDIGFYGLYDTSGSQDLYAGLFRDANDSGKWKLFKDNQAAPTTTVDTSGTGYAVGTLVADIEGNVTGNTSGTAATVTGAAQSNITSLGTLTTLTVDSIIIDGTNIGHTSDTDAIGISSGGVVNFTQSPTVASAAIKTAGKETIYVPASAMYPNTTNGCAALAQVEQATDGSRPELKVLDFDKDSDEFAQFTVAFPKSWNGDHITYRVFWIGIAATTGVAWALQGLCSGDNAESNAAFGTAVVVQDDSQGDATEVLVSAESGNVTLSGEGDDKMTFFQIYRDVSDGNDDMAGDARLLGIQIFFTTDAATDA